MPTTERAAEYLAAYVAQYRLEYARFTAPPPTGGGYPAVPISPYQYGGELACYLAVDGAVILDSSHEPPYRWDIAGGPAIMSDTEPSRTPSWVTAALEAEGILGQNLGIYRVVSKTAISDAIWKGQLGKPTESRQLSVENVDISITRYRYRWEELIRRLTFGVMGLILDTKLPDENANFWQPQIISGLLFLPSDSIYRRFFRYAELLRHADASAWDPRAAWVRAHVDVRRDFARTASRSVPAGATLTLGEQLPPIGAPFLDQLNSLRIAAAGFEQLLDQNPDAPESLFHDYLRANPALIDVYGEVDSKPKFHYPNSGPTGKSYVEPDFIVRFPNRTYRMIEIERPDHNLATSVGHPKVAVTHAAYQIAEWKQFIADHYDVISGTYPGISSGVTSAIIMSRDTERSFGKAADRLQYMSLLRQQLNVSEVWTFDDLVTRARKVVTQLEALATSLSGYPDSA